MAWSISSSTICRTSSEGQTCSLVLMTLTGTLRGTVVLASWLAEGVGRETRIAMKAINSILCYSVSSFDTQIRNTVSVPKLLLLYPSTDPTFMYQQMSYSCGDHSAKTDWCIVYTCTVTASLFVENVVQLTIEKASPTWTNQPETNPAYDNVH